MAADENTNKDFTIRRHNGESYDALLPTTHMGQVYTDNTLTTTLDEHLTNVYAPITDLAGKVDKTSIVDNLTTDDATKVLSAKQGKVLNDTVDLLDTRIEDIEDGTTVVKKAEQDHLGNVINTTYETKTDANLVRGRVTLLENANMFKEVNYNNVNGVLTFTRYDDTTKEIDLPLELIVTSGYYDEVTNELVLVLANGSEIRIPVGNLLTDLDAHNIRFNGSGTNYLTDKTEVEDAVTELDTRVKTNADNVALKVNTSDIVNDLTSTDTNKPLSANQGKALKDLIDTTVGNIDAILDSILGV